MPTPSDDTIIEKLTPRLVRSRTRASSETEIRQAIGLARQTADPRYFGQAQAMMGSQWNSPEASYEMATLQATIEQSRHEFEAAKKTLHRALQRPAASKAQAWLTLAGIERVQGRYVQAEQACRNIQEPGAWLYAKACSLENLSLTGQWSLAREGYTDLMRQARQPSQQAWLASLLAENELRSGNFEAANKQFAFSLSLDSDVYTSIAYADALLDNKQVIQALNALKTAPRSDAVLIRQARAYSHLNEPEAMYRANNLKKELLERLAESNGRAAAKAHAREQALFAFYVRNDAQSAWKHAQENLTQQREPIDWQIALLTAQSLGHWTEHKKLLAQMAQQGLKDVRLESRVK